MKPPSAVEVGTALLKMEISKDNISGIEALLEMTKMLCERLVKGKMKKSHLDDWEKDAIAGHKKMILRCDITLKMLSNLKPILVIELESESLPPPSAPPSVAEPEEEERKFCDLCKKHFEGQFDTVCDPCEARSRLLAETDKLQDEKDKLSTELSLQKSSLRTKTLQIIKNLEAVGYENLDAGRKKRLTMARKRIAEEDGGSSTA